MRSTNPREMPHVYGYIHAKLSSSEFRRAPRTGYRESSREEVVKERHVNLHNEGMSIHTHSSIVHLLIHWFIDPFSVPSICPSIHRSIYPIIQHSSINSFIHQYIHLSIHLSIDPSIHPSIHPFFHPSIHPSIFIHEPLIRCFQNFIDCWAFLIRECLTETRS